MIEQGQARAAAVRVVGGRPTRQQVAAVVAALAAGTSADADATAPEPPPAWLRASLAEGAGRPIVATTSDLPSRAW